MNQHWLYEHQEDKTDTEKILSKTQPENTVVSKYVLLLSI